VEPNVPKPPHDEPRHETLPANGAEAAFPGADAETEATLEPEPGPADWKKQLLRDNPEQQQFAAIRMCIVQREETIDSIAARYNLHSREILLYNRLEEPSVHEGQIIYIPKAK